MTPVEPAPVDDLRQRSVRSASALLVGQGFRFVISMTSQIVLARLLFPADFGLVAMIAPIIGFVTLFADFGLLQAVVQRETVTQSLLSSVFWANVAISIGLALFFAGLTPILVYVYSEPRLGPIGFISSAMIAVTGLGQMHGALLTRELRFSRIVIIEVVALLAGLGCGILGALNGWSYWAIIASQIAASLTTTILNIAVTRWTPSRPALDPEIAAMLGFGGQVTGSKVVGYLNASVDTMLIGLVLGATSLGVYDRAWRLAAMPLGQLCAPVDRLAMPILSRLQSDPPRYRRAFEQMIQVLCLLAMPGLLYGVVGAGQFIPLLLGDRWLDVVPVFRWVCIGALISPLNSASFWLFTSQARTGEQLRWSVIVSLINIAAYASGLYWGIEGVAMASALSVYALQAPLLIYATTRSGVVDLKSFLSAAWPVPAALLVITPLLIGLISLLPARSVVSIFVTLGAAYSLAALALMLFPAGRRCLAMIYAIVPLRMRAPFARWTPLWLATAAQ